jgi:hypothetical protein
MKNGTTAPPGYVLPNRPSWQGGWNIRSVVGAAVAFVLAASAATEWLAIQLNNPVEMGYPIVWVRGTARRQPPYQFWSSQGPLDCIWSDHRRRTLSGLFDVLVSLPHSGPQKHGQSDEPAWLRNLGQT